MEQHNCTDVQLEYWPMITGNFMVDIQFSCPNFQLTMTNVKLSEG